MFHRPWIKQNEINRVRAGEQPLNWQHMKVITDAILVNIVAFNEPRSKVQLTAILWHGDD